MQIILLGLALTLIITAIWSGGQLVFSILDGGRYLGESRSRERSGWWLRGASFVAAASLAYFVSIKYVDPYTWWCFFATVGIAAWLTASTIMTRRMAEEITEFPEWFKPFWGIAIFSIVGGIVLVPFGGYWPLWGMTVVAATFAALPHVCAIWYVLWSAKKSQLRDYAFPVIAAMVILGVVGLLVTYGFGTAYRVLVKTRAAVFIHRAITATPARGALPTSGGRHHDRAHRRPRGRGLPAL